MRRARALLELPALLTVEIAAVVLLLRLGRLAAFSPPPGGWRPWLVAGPAEEVLVAVLRVIALGCALWLLSSTVLYALARLARLRRAAAALEWLTLPVVRRAADRAVAVLLAAGAAVGSGGPAIAWSRPGAVVALVGPGGVAEAPTFDGAPRAGPAVVLPEPLAPIVAPPEVPPPGASSVSGAAYSAMSGGEDAGARRRVPNVQAGSSAGGSSVPGGAAGAAAAAAAASSGVSAPAPEAHVVVAGEHLWRIARQRLAEARGLAAAEVRPRDVHGYWIALIDANRATLRSGDPNLVFPGEQLILPPVPPA